MELRETELVRFRHTPVTSARLAGLLLAGLAIVAVSIASLAFASSSAAASKVKIRITPANGQWVSSDSPRVRFRAPGRRPEYFACRIDGKKPRLCASPFRLRKLQQGRHRLRIDAFNANGKRIASGRLKYRIDSRPPRTRVRQSPKPLIRTIAREATMKLELEKNRDTKRFECQVDGQSWERCTRRVSVSALPGRHRIRMRAVDAAGNRDPDPVLRKWRVNRWEPDIRAARRYARRRGGVVSFAVDVGWRTQGVRMHRRARTASTIKVLLMAAYLRKRGVRHQRLRASEKHMLGIMIRHSDNGAASTVRNIVGSRAIRRVARKGGMKRFRYSPVWGTCKVSARDFAVFMRNLKTVIPKRHRGFAFRQLRKITGYQRWGIGRVRHRGWSLFFKGGWGISDGGYGGVVSHQVAVLRHGKWRIGLAVLTQGNSSVTGGNGTLRGVAARLLRRLPARPEG